VFVLLLGGILLGVKIARDERRTLEEERKKTLA
jgi:hypothetical protein